MTDITVATSTSTSNGGFLYAIDSTGTQTMTIIMDGTSTYMSGLSSTGGSGGAFYINAALGSFSMTSTSSTIATSTASINGGFAYIKAASSITISKATMTSITSTNSGSIIYSSASSTVYSISNSIFKCLSAPFTNNEPSLTNSLSNIGGAFYIVSATSITSNTNTIENCYIGDVGGAYYLQNT